jgi:hypothetical protein
VVNAREPSGRESSADATVLAMEGHERPEPAGPELPLPARQETVRSISEDRASPTVPERAQPGRPELPPPAAEEPPPPPADERPQSTWVFVVSTLDVIGVVLALLFGVPAWAAAAAGGAALAIMILRHRLTPKSEAWAVAVCVGAAVVAGFAAEGMRATFFEPAHSTHRYVVAGIPETAEVRRRTEPREDATELLGNPLVLGESADVACTMKVGRYEWAQLQSDTTWVPLGFLRRAPGESAAPQCH